MSQSASTSLKTIWGTKETRQSLLLAQTLKYCPAFRKAFLGEVFAAGNSSVKALIGDYQERASREVEVEQERWLDSKDRIDLLIHFGSDLVIGVENKIGASLQPNQLNRYWANLKQSSRVPLVVLLAPSTFVLAETDIPETENFVRISYAQMSTCATACGETPERGFSSAYYRDLAYLWEEFDLTPLNPEDIAALVHDKQVQRSLSKLKKALSEFGGRIENDPGNFILTTGSRNQELPVFVGVRYGTDWYYRRPLLNGRTEAIAYMKEEKLIGSRSNEINLNLQAWAVANRADVEVALDCKLDFYPREGPNECRLALRRSLDTLVSGPDTLTDWLRQAQNKLLSIPL